MAFPNYASGQPAAQTIFALADPAGCPENFIFLANVITGPKVPQKVREVETTAHPTAQTSSATIPATYIPTIREAGIMTFDISVKTDTPQHSLIMQWMKLATFVNFKIVNADSLLTQILGQGFFVQADLDFPVAGMVKGTFGIRISGDVDYGG